MIRLRHATLDDLTLLEYWDTQPHVIASDPDEDWDWAYELGRNPTWREQLIAELNGRPMGCIQIIDPFLEESGYWHPVEKNKRAIDIWIGEAEDLGKGYGTQMMELAIKRCFQESKVSSILVDPLESNTKAHNFYQKLGFVHVENRTFNETPCKIFELKRISEA